MNKIDPKVNPIPADNNQLDPTGPYYKMPYVYKMYGIHIIGSGDYHWFERMPEAEFLRLYPENGNGWERVWRSVSEAHQL